MSTVRRLIPTVSIVLVVLVAGMWLGGHPEYLPGFVRHGVVDDRTDRISEAIEKIDDVYYRRPSDRDLTDGAIRGMVEGLDDRFSNYFTAKEYASFRRDQSGEFAGIGVTVSAVKNGMKVGSVQKGAPASKAGVRAGDVITRAGGRSLAGLTTAAARELIVGEEGTDVTITFVHDGRSRTVTATRQTIEDPMVESELVRRDGQAFGVVALSQFGSGAHAEVYAALKKLEKQGAKKFVLDLRNNGGGLVSEAQLIVSAFIRSGPVVTTKGRAVPKRTLTATGEPVEPDAPLVVLVNRGSASASEIVTGALQDDKRATIVGTRTFGKGVFQQILELSNGGALDITAGQYFTPSGRNLGGRGVKTGAGITPDVKAEDDPDTARDEGLDKALSVLAAKA